MDDDDNGNVRGAHRPLGRGLEDVSHLFLSPRTPDGPRPAETPDPAASARETAVVLRSVALSRERLAAILPPDWSGALEDGLRALDARIPCPPCGEIDVLAVDRAGKLTVIDFDATASDALLVRALAHVDWVARNAATVRRLCPAEAFDASLPPRAIVLAPQFSPLLRRAMRQVSRHQVQWVRYHAVETPTGPALVLEPVTGD